MKKKYNTLRSGALARVLPRVSSGQHANAVEPTSDTSSLGLLRRLQARLTRAGQRNSAGRTRALTLAIMILAILGTSTQVEAQAWIRNPGSAYFNLGYRTILAKRFFGPDGSPVEINPYRQHSLALYSEVGIVDRWLMATLDGEVFRRNVLVDQGATTGLGDLRLGLFSGLYEGPVNVSLGVYLGLPTGDPVPRGESPSEDAISVLLPTGDGEFDVTPTVAIGGGFGWLRVQQFVQATLGYAIRTTPREVAIGDPSDIRDQLVYRLETGIRVDRDFLRRFWFIVRFAGQVVVQRRSDGFSRQGVAGLGDGVEFHSFGVELLMDIAAGFGLGVGYDGAFGARNVAAAPALKFSLSYEIR